MRVDVVKTGQDLEMYAILAYTDAAAVWPHSPCMPQGNLPDDRASAPARLQIGRAHV